MIRVLDVLFAFFGLVFGSPVLVVLTILGLFDTGSPFFARHGSDGISAPSYY